MCSPVLAFPRPDLPYVLDTDASDYGVGAVLSQVNTEGEQVISYYSRALSSSQQKYCTTRKELLAAVSAAGHYRGKDFESALANLDAVLDRISKFGLQLKTSKCKLFRSEVPFLGHVVGREDLSCDPEKISAVKEWRPPQDVRGVREFLGFVGYYRRFIPHFANISRPIADLAAKGANFV